MRIKGPNCHIFMKAGETCKLCGHTVSSPAKPTAAKIAVKVIPDVSTIILVSPEGQSKVFVAK